MSRRPPTVRSSVQAETDIGFIRVRSSAQVQGPHLHSSTADTITTNYLKLRSVRNKKCSNTSGSWKQLCVPSTRFGPKLVHERISNNENYRTPKSCGEVFGLGSKNTDAKFQLDWTIRSRDIMFEGVCTDELREYIQSSMSFWATILKIFQALCCFAGLCISRTNMNLISKIYTPWSTKVLFYMHTFALWNYVIFFVGTQIYHFASRVLYKDCELLTAAKYCIFSRISQSWSTVYVIVRMNGSSISWQQQRFEKN
ncbi:unnamed protein product [Caenorhabditis sp. 36 PRJEB53466]|nr:unnamed protein product [Caenorhabditis sp. 36 PRJEB53466]